VPDRTGTPSLRQFAADFARLESPKATSSALT
jgi:hypothetical protein